MKLFNDHGRVRETEDQPLGAGGEGSVYRFTKSDRSLRRKVAKVYNDPAQAGARLGKIAHMIGNPPISPSDPVSQYLVWPEELLYDDTGDFRGYVMPLVHEAIDLETFCTPLPCSDPRFARFDHRQGGALLRRATIAMNLAAAIEALHRRRDYVLVDLKSHNVKINPQGILSLVDMDSVQITDSSGSLFPCPVLTPEFAPPEYHLGKASPASGAISETWDRFCYAVLIYRLLFGLHPFAGSYRDSSLTTIMDGIREGCFANGAGRGKFHVVPKQHDGFAQVPPTVQDAFRRALDDGHTDPDARPAMREWYDTLYDAVTRGKSTLARATVAGNLPPQRPPGPARRPPPAGPRVQRPAGGGPPPVRPAPVRQAFFTAMTKDILFALPSGKQEVIGRRVTLTWRTPGASCVRSNFAGSLRKLGGMPLSGAATVDVYRSTTFVLRVRYGLGRPFVHKIDVPVLAHKVPLPAAIRPHGPLGAPRPIGSTSPLSMHRPLNSHASLNSPGGLRPHARMAEPSGKIPRPVALAGYAGLAQPSKALAGPAALKVPRAVMTPKAKERRGEG